MKMSSEQAAQLMGFGFPSTHTISDAMSAAGRVIDSNAGRVHPAPDFRVAAGVANSGGSVNPIPQGMMRAVEAAMGKVPKNRDQQVDDALANLRARIERFEKTLDVVNNNTKASFANVDKTSQAVVAHANEVSASVQAIAQQVTDLGKQVGDLAAAVHQLSANVTAGNQDLNAQDSALAQQIATLNAAVSALNASATGTFSPRPAAGPDNRAFAPRADIATLRDVSGVGMNVGYPEPTMTGASNGGAPAATVQPALSGWGWALR